MSTSIILYDERFSPSYGIACIRGSENWDEIPEGCSVEEAWVAIKSRIEAAKEKCGEKSSEISTLSGWMGNVWTSSGRNAKLGEDLRDMEMTTLMLNIH